VPYSIPCPCRARFLEKILPERSEAWRFFSKPEGLDLAGQTDAELPLHNETEGVKIYIVVYWKILCTFVL